MEKVKSFFRPELINRLDSIIEFNPLTSEMIRKIVEVQLEEVSKRLAKQRLELEVTDILKKHLTV